MFFPWISMREIGEETRMNRKGTLGSRFGPRRGVENGSERGKAEVLVDLGLFFFFATRAHFFF